MVIQCINIRQVPREVLKTAASDLGFQHLFRDLANVNAWKTMFDPMNTPSGLFCLPLFPFGHLIPFRLDIFYVQESNRKITKFASFFNQSTDSTG